MRDTFLGLNQKRVLELKQKYLDGKGESSIKTEDLILIRRIQDFMNSSKTIQAIIENEVYSWVHYETVQEDLPMIFPSVASVKKRVEKLKKLGVIINKTYRVSKKMIEETKREYFEKTGVYSVIRLSKECRTIFDFTTEQHHDSVNGFCHEGVKGQHHEGVNDKHHEGVNKEYHEFNTVKGVPFIIAEIEKIEVGEELKTKLIEFFNFRKELKKPIKTMSSINKLISSIGKTFIDESDLMECIDNSIMNGYQGVFPNKNKKTEVKKKSFAQRELERLEAEEKNKKKWRDL